MGSPVWSKYNSWRRKIGSLCQNRRLLSMMIKQLVSGALISDLGVFWNLSRSGADEEKQSLIKQPLLQDAKSHDQ
jgi:hypothetical protein